VLVSRAVDLAAGPNVIELPRRSVPGRYGVLVRVPDGVALLEVRLGSEGRDLLVAEPPDDARAAYHHTSARGVPVYAQVTERMWLGTDQRDPFRPAGGVQIPWRERLAALTAPIAAAQHERNALAQDLHNVSEHYRVLREESHARAQGSDALREQVDALRTANDKLGAEKDELEQSIGALRVQVEEAQARFDEMAARYRKIERLFETVGRRHGRGLLDRLTRPGTREGPKSP
jgi:hypothetical protein